jgi:hypothetical protein
MKKIVLLLMGLLFLPVPVIAYQVYIDAPDTLTVGKPLVVTGTTTFGIGTPIDVVLYYQLTTTSEVKRKIVYIQTDKTFKAVFDTTGLKTGTYKVEVPTSGMGGDSVTQRVIQLVDRTDEIFISSSLTQPFSGKLNVAGSIRGAESSGIQIEVIDPDNTVIFGPRYVNTNYVGDFAVEVPVTQTGNYEVSFTDAKGYIGAKTFTVLEAAPVSASVSETPGPAVPSVSAHARASRDRPAYFIVRTSTGPATLSTSSSIDWVVEYIDDRGTRQVMNAQGEQNAERIDLTGSGKTIYVKIYPQKATASGEVFLYGQNVNSVSVSPDTPAVFAPVSPTPGETTPEAPLTPLTGIGAVLCAIICLHQRG